MFGQHDGLTRGLDFGQNLLGGHAWQLNDFQIGFAHGHGARHVIIGF